MRSFSPPLPNRGAIAHVPLPQRRHLKYITTGESVVEAVLSKTCFWSVGYFPCCGQLSDGLEASAAKHLQHVEWPSKGNKVNPETIDGCFNLWLYCAILAYSTDDYFASSILYSGAVTRFHLSSFGLGLIF